MLFKNMITISLEEVGKNLSSKGPVKLIQGVKIAHSRLQPGPNLLHFIILSLPV